MLVVVPTMVQTVTKMKMFVSWRGEGRYNVGGGTVIYLLWEKHISEDIKHSRDTWYTWLLFSFFDLGGLPDFLRGGWRCKMRDLRKVYLEEENMLSIKSWHRWKYLDLAGFHIILCFLFTSSLCIILSFTVLNCATFEVAR